MFGHGKVTLIISQVFGLKTNPFSFNSLNCFSIRPTLAFDLYNFWAFQ